MTILVWDLPTEPCVYLAASEGMLEWQLLCRVRSLKSPHHTYLCVPIDDQMIVMSRMLQILTFSRTNMHNSIDSNSAQEHNRPMLDMSQLQELLRQRALHPPDHENVAILGCGYVGSALARFWRDQGHMVTGTTTNPDRATQLAEVTSQVKVMKGDDYEAVESLVQGQDTVVVSIAPLGNQMADEAAYEHTYLDTAKNLVAALEQAPTVKQIVYLSSCSVYGDRQGEWVDETASVTPLEHRSQVIWEAEQLFLQASHVRTCVLRLGGIYGPGRDFVSMFAGLAGNTLPGKGDRFVNWIHRDDIVEAIEFARANQLDGIYNLVDDSQLTVREQVELVCRQYRLPPVHWDVSQLGYRRKSLRVSNDKLKSAGYQLVYPQIVV